MIDTLKIISELETRLAAVTDADVERSTRTVTALDDKDKVLGTIESIPLQKLWAVAQQFEFERVKHLADAKYMANSEEEAKAAATKAERAHTLGELATRLFWTESREQIGQDAWDAPNGIGIRKRWQIVASGASPMERLHAALLERLLPDLSVGTGETEH